MDRGQEQHLIKITRWKKRRIAVWSVTAVAFLTGYFHRTVIGVVSDSLMRDFSIERATDLGFLASIYFWTYAAMQLPAGIMVDRFGPRRVVSAALLVATVGTLMFGLADSLAALYLGRLTTTLGIGVIFVSLIKLQAEWFRPREFATMTGLIVLIGNSGSLLAATPMAFLTEIWGWRNSFHLIATYSLVMAAACWLIVRNRPEDIGLPNITEIESAHPVKRTLVEKPAVRIRDCVKTVCLNPRTWPPVIAGIAVYGVYMSISGVWGIPYFMQVYSLSRVEASQLIFTMVLGNMAAAPIIGLLSDRILYRRWPFMAAILLFMSGLLLLNFWNGAKPPAAWLYPICISFGIGVSGLTLAVACVKEISPPHTAGIAAGITNSGPFLGAAVMQPSFGWVLDRYWSGAFEQGVKVYPQIAYENAFWLCIAVLFLGLFASFFIQETRCGMFKP